MGLLFTSYLTNYVVQCSLAAGMNGRLIGLRESVAGIMVFLCLKELIPVTLSYLEPGVIGNID